MKNKKIVFGSILIVSVFLLLFSVTQLIKSSKSIDIALEKNYDDVIYVSDKAKFLMILKENKLSNLLFLNKEAANSLADRGIEKKGIEDAIELIIDHLKSDDLLNDTNNIEVKSLKQSGSYQNITSAFNKNLVVYGINKETVDGSFTIDKVLNQFHLEERNHEIDNIGVLYEYSKGFLE